MLGVMWVNVAILGGDFKVKIVHAGGGYECGTGCICSNEDSTPMTCRGPAVCNNVNAGAGSVDKVFIDNLGTCDPKWGTYSFDQYCDWPCGTVESGGNCGSQTPGSCGLGTCGSGKTCVSVGNPPNACQCANDNPPIWAGSHDGNFGVQETSASCLAWGWVTNLSKPSNDISISITADGTEIYSGFAGDYRSGLESYCTGGTCAFNVDLLNQPSYPHDGAEHNILITAGTFLLPATDNTVNPPTERNWTQRKITCPNCTNSAPDAPVISTPTNGQQLRVGTPATINWPDIGSWGMACTNPSNHYEMCIKSNEPGTCDYVGNWNLGTTSQYPWTPGVADPSVWLYAGSHNGVPPTVWSNSVQVCVEGGASYGYGACDPVSQTAPRTSCSETCGTDDCAAVPLTVPCCIATYPDTPTLVSPANGAEITYGTNVTMDWNDIASWGYACPANDNHYNVCVSQVSGSCTLENTPTGLTSYATRPATIKGNIYWSATADNSAFESQSITRNFCVEGFDITNTSYVSAWSSCNSSHQRTRTCTENCGTNNCTGIPLVENCIGTITGTLFDASDLSSCPADIGTNPSYTSLRFSNANFDLNGPWPAISLPVSTDANGNYSESVYASSNGIYSFDYTDLISSGIAAGIKTECGQAAATVTDQGQTVTKNTGFWRNYGGWWQAKGGSVYGDDDLRSEIPSSLPTEMSLILPNPTAGNRRGLLSYGVPRPTNMLGSNPNAKVSTSLWEIESKYAGQIYDWNFYDNRFNLFTTTAWSTGQPVDYTATDTTNGYKILKSAGSVTSFNYSPSANQFVIFHINGDVKVTSNITVPQGAFLAIIAKGTITFDPSIAQAGGWYVGTSLAFPCHDIGSNGCDEDDQQFQGKGSFIGWNSVSLGRSNQSLNNTQPSELFTYSLDLFLNAPKPMKYYTKHYKPFIP